MTMKSYNVTGYMLIDIETTVEAESEEDAIYQVHSEINNIDVHIDGGYCDDITLSAEEVK